MSLILFFGALVLFYFLGFITKRSIESKGAVADEEGLKTVGASLLALFAFFLGFTFSISASKIEQVRSASVAEANNIGTALLRVELYDENDQVELKKLFRNYIEKRIEYFQNVNVKDANADNLIESNQAAYTIWSYVVQLTKAGNEAQARLMIPALNAMIDSVTTRDADIRATLPPAIIGTLYILSFCSCFIVGFSMQRSMISNVIAVIYMIMIGITVLLILDASNPSKGLISTQKANQKIVQLMTAFEE